MIAALYGRDHTALDHVADARVDETTSIALTRGRYPKGYAHMDPNEDAVLAASLPGGRLLVVADGHNGVEAAHAAITAIEKVAPRVLQSPARDPEDAVEELFAVAQHGVRDALARADEPRTRSRTALSVVLVTPKAAYTATSGDTAVLVVRNGKAKVVSGTGPFLGPRSSLPEVLRTKLRGRETVVAVTDGVTDYVGRSWEQVVGSCVADADTAHAAALALVEAAMAGGAGDNVAVALTDV